MVIVGGLGSLIGGVIGAAALFLLEELSIDITDNWQFFVGVGLLALVLGAPRGLTGRCSAEGGAMTELSCSGLQKAFGGLVVTDDLALSVASGEIHALIGPNGAGKTTALAQLSGELRPDAGTVWLDDADITDLSLPQRVHAGVARSYQISSVFRDFTARENVELALQAMDRHSFRFFRPAARNAERIERAEALLDQVGLGEDATVSAQRLSHGQTRQLEIAMAMASDPQVLLLDEPMAGMPRRGRPDWPS